MASKARLTQLFTCGALALGCRGGAAVGGAAPVVSSAQPAPTTAPHASTARLPDLTVVLDDPRLAAARDLERARDHAGAARAIEDAKRGVRPEDACAWDYVEARLLAAASDERHEPPLAAAAAFDRASAAVCTLAPYAKLRAA